MSYADTIPALYITHDGREICRVGGNDGTASGQREYKLRVEQMAERQNHICCLYGHAPCCPGSLIGYRATFEHENGRGGGKRDDRIELPDGTWVNGAAHMECNGWKGSRRIDYNSGLQFKAH